MKLLEFQGYFNGYRAHAGLDGRPPENIPEERIRASLGSYRCSSTVAVSIKRRWRREVCARRTQAVRAKRRPVDRLKAVVSSRPEGICVESTWRVHSVRSRVHAAHD
jgi:hypothetical protein